MTESPPIALAPRLIKGGVALVDPENGTVLRVIALQYNPENLSRTLQPQAVGAENGADRSQALRLKGPPVETYKLEAEIDAADQLGAGDANTAQLGILPQLAALELLIYPASAELQEYNRLAGQGVLQIAPIEAPLTLFIWSVSRVMPVRVTDFSVTEEFFDIRLNPIRAKVSLGMRVLSVSDLGFAHRGGALYMRYQREKERLGGLASSVAPNILGLQEIPR